MGRHRFVRRTDGQFKDLHDGLLWVSSGEHEPFCFEAFDVEWVHFVAMSETLGDRGLLAIEQMGEGVFGDEDFLRAQSHRAAEAFDLLLFRKFADDCGLIGGIKLGARGISQAEHIAGELDDGDLKAEADPEVGQMGLAAMFDAGDLSFDTARAEPPRDDDAVEISERLGDGLVVDVRSFDPVLIDATLEVGGAVFESLVDGCVGIAEFGIFAGDADGDAVLARRSEACDELAPTDTGFVFMA